MKTLRIYLIINAIFSNVCGWVMISQSGKINELFGLSSNNVFPIIGSMLLFFSFFVFYVSAKQLNNKKIINLISFLDALWVLGSILILAFNLFNLSSLGKIIIAIIAVWIGFLGLKQYHNNK